MENQEARSDLIGNNEERKDSHSEDLNIENVNREDESDYKTVNEIEKQAVERNIVVEDEIEENDGSIPRLENNCTGIENCGMDTNTISTPLLQPFEDNISPNAPSQEFIKCAESKRVSTQIVAQGDSDKNFDILGYSRASRALRRGGSIMRNGVNGRNGRIGQNGMDGEHGRPGLSGPSPMDGESGRPGCDGQHGSNGSNGEPAPNPKIRLWELLNENGVQKIHITDDSRPYFIDISNGKYVVIESRGGKGGNGGNGGIGGRGGNGGNGGSVKGTSGNAVAGNGGTGGKGGRGGNGGHGGHGGSGGMVDLITSDPSLFSFVGVDVEGGDYGCGGLGGSGGAPGKHGERGSGGAYIFWKTAHPESKPGANGTLGEAGLKGSPGIVNFIHMGEDGRIVESGNKLYSPSVVRFNVSPFDDDGIFEPGEWIAISSIWIQNFGDITLPAGAELILHSDHITADKIIPLPSIPPHFRIQLTEKILVQLSPDIKSKDLSSPLFIDGVIQASIRFQGRGFVNHDSSCYAKIPICNPLEFVQIPSKVITKRNGLTSLDFKVRNTSIHDFDYRVGQSSRHVTFSYTVPENYSVLWGTESLQSAIGTLHNVQAGSDIPVSLKIITDNECKYYDNGVCILELMIDGRLIERHEISFICCPQYEVDIEYDALLICDSDMSRTEYETYTETFKILNLKYTIWDADIQNGISYIKETSVRHRPTWVDQFKGKLIVFHCSSANKFSMLDLRDIKSHFLTENPFSLECIGSDISLDDTYSGFLFLSPVENVLPYRRNILTQIVDSSDIVKNVEEKTFTMTYRLSEPKEEEYYKIVKEYEKKYDKRFDKIFYHLCDSTLAMEQLSKSIIGTTYSFARGGTLYRLKGIHSQSRFFSLYLKENLRFSKHSIIQKDSTYLKLIYSILASLSIEMKLRIYHQVLPKADEIVKFQNENSEPCSILYLIQSSIYCDILSDANSKHFCRLKHLIEQILKDKSLLNDTIIHLVIILLHNAKNEFISFRSRYLYFPYSAEAGSLDSILKNFIDKLKEMNIDISVDMVVKTPPLLLNLKFLETLAPKPILN